MKISHNRILYMAPVLFWFFSLLTRVLGSYYLLADNSWIDVYRSISYTYPLDIVTFLVFYLYFAPKFFKKTKLLLNVSLAILYMLAYGLVWAFVYYLMGVEVQKLPAIYLSSQGHILLYSFYGIVLRISIDWFNKRDEKKELERQNTITELALLRSQINPHFLFNSLNNINSFTNTNPDKASFAIIKLSNIMRYMLYEATGEYVMMEKEIDYLKDYLDLQKIRYNKDIVNFRIGNIQPNMFVPPMLFIPFIENAFKHGRKHHESKIYLELDYQENKLIFICENEKRIKTESEISQPSGIGIDNVKRRLELLYPSTHNLNITDNEKFYKVDLKIDIL